MPHLKQPVGLYSTPAYRPFIRDAGVRYLSDPNHLTSPLPPYAPNRRQSSFAGVSAACSLSAAMICSSLNLDFLISPPFVIPNAEDSHLRWYSFRGAGHYVHDRKCRFQKHVRIRRRPNLHHRHEWE